MSIAEKLVLRRQRHLKWRALDRLETILMVMCGICLFGFSTSVAFDIITRTIGHPWLWLQEVTSAFFIYGIFTGAAAATRRNDHLYLTAVAEAMHGRSRLVVEVIVRVVTLAVALCLIYFGYINFLRGFSSYRMPSMTPIASLYVAIPVSAARSSLPAGSHRLPEMIRISSCCCWCCCSPSSAISSSRCPRSSSSCLW